MTSPQILPTVGRVVWFYPSSNTGETGFARHSGGPYAALIARVWNNGLVNLCVFDANGTAHSRHCVPFVQADRDLPDYAFCDWMPFQKGQAVKAKMTEKVTATAPATQQYREPSQRDQLECALVSGAAIHLAANTDQAYKIAAGIKTVLDALHPAPPVAPIAKPDGCRGTNCASVNGLNHSRECITEAAATQGWTPTAEDFSASELSVSAQADQRMESEIAAAGLDAPRVTADQIQALMNRVDFRYEHPDFTTSTFAHAFLDGFYLATGHSACVSPENYKPALGQKYAREQAEPKARDKLWELEGYVLHRDLAGTPRKNGAAA